MAVAGMLSTPRRPLRAPLHVPHAALIAHRAPIVRTVGTISRCHISNLSIAILTSGRRRTTWISASGGWTPVNAWLAVSNPLFTSQHQQRLPYRKASAAADPRGFGPQRKAEQAVQPWRNAFDPACQWSVR